ncbi:calmodulin-binding protein 25-like [Impatiens glandulifera]|uniref:calmodulin-binding protein 25-like n=1 Tax=Impatiens glandulifera TaxID=253017 RepID=UPI001FB0ADC3|nr:calmodulin-binding protein 25-like [Impatiens glandulifera]
MASSSSPSSSHNLATIEPWMFRSSFPDSWISQSFERDNQTLTKALQVSLSTPHHLQTIPPSIPIPIQSPSPPGNAKRTLNPPIPLKKKSRKSKRAATTFIMADPENFRQMVQQVTGGGQVRPMNVPLLKPEPQRLFNLMQGCCLPTLDTSAFLLDDKYQPPPMAVSSSSPSLMNHSPAVNFDSFSCFPTLESWKVL